MAFSENKKRKVLTEHNSHEYLNRNITEPVNEYNTLQVFIVEIVEDNILPGGILIFGKIVKNGELESVCIRVKEILREIYFSLDW